MTLRVKAKLHSIKQYCSCAGREVTFDTMVLSEEETKDTINVNKHVPCGEFKVYVDNPKALEQLTLGACYYIDFSQAAK